MRYTTAEQGFVAPGDLRPDATRSSGAPDRCECGKRVSVVVSLRKSTIGLCFEHYEQAIDQMKRGSRRGG